jgi:hypothetical protein
MHPPPREMFFTHRSLSAAFIILVLLFSVSARSQERDSRESQDKSTEAETKKKAIDLLLSVVGQVDTLRSPENRARIRSNAAEVLWNADEKQARSVFAAVADDLKAGFSEYESEAPTYSNSRRENFERYQTFMVFWQLRRDTIDRIAKHDPDLALEFLNATKPPETIKLPEQVATAEEFLSLYLAGQVAAKNPQLALKIGRESLAHGFSNDLLSVLVRIQRKNRETSQTFYRAIVDKLREANLMTDRGAREFAFNLVRSYQPPDADELAYRDLLGMLMKIALDSGCGDEQSENSGEICYQLGPLFSELQKYYNQRAAPLKRWASDDQQEDGRSSIPAEVREIVESGSVNELLELTKKYPQLEGFISYQAFLKASDGGNFDQAQKIAEATNGEMRGYMVSQLKEAQRFITKGEDRKAAIQEVLSNMTTDEQIQYLLSLAGWFAARDRKTAFGFLDQVSELIDREKPGRTKLMGQVELAIAYAFMKSRRGFPIVESMIPRLNQLVSAAMQLDGVETSYVRDEEWNMNNQGVIGGVLAELAQNAGYFAAIDFDRTVALAGQMERPELRLMAELKIAQGVFREQPGAPAFRRNYYRY